MSISFPGHTAPNAGFEVPLEMLGACHGRIENYCAILRRLVDHLGTGVPDADSRNAAASVIRYFDTAAVDHHQDEEVDLFPALLESMAGSDPICIRELVEQLSAEHRELETHWRTVRERLSRIAAGESAGLNAEIIEPMVELYHRHLQREDDELIPMAARLLDDAALNQIGKRMRERRGVVFEKPV